MPFMRSRRMPAPTMMRHSLLRTFSEMSQFTTFEERFDYLSLKGTTFERTFGLDRYINQRFYRSTEWRNIRHAINVRDEGRDLGMDGYEIAIKPIIHHMNPISMQDFEEGNDDILNPEFLITVSLQTHNAIHYGTRANLPQPPVERTPGDTIPWR